MSLVGNIELTLEKMNEDVTAQKEAENKGDDNDDED